MSKTLIIVRHAHRDKTLGRNKDNGLSTKGQKQTRKIFDYFFDRFPEEERPLICSSPKKRCLETLEPIANKLALEIQVTPLLDEQGPEETSLQFTKRMKKFCDEWKESTLRTTLISSHGDCIPLLLEILTGARAELKKGGWAQMEQDGIVQLTWLIQELS